MRKNWYSILICAVSTLVLFCTLGLATSTISIYLPYIIGGGGLTRTQGSFLLSLRSLSSLVTIVVVVERFYRRFKLRWGIVCALFLDVVAFTIYGMARAYIQYCIAAVLAGMAYGIGGIIPVSILIGRWFKTNRSFATGICTAGSGVATIVVPPAFVALAEGISMRAAFLSMAGLIVLVMALAAVTLRDDPELAGQEPFCSNMEEKAARMNHAPAEIDRTGRIVVLLGVMLLGAASHSANQHIGVLYTGNGISEAMVSVFVSISGIALTLGKMMCGYVDDRIGGRKTHLVFSSFFAAGLVLTTLAARQNALLDLAAVVILNCGMPLTTVGTTMIAHDMSTEKTYARMMKDCQSVTMIGAVVFTTVPGMISDLTGSYVPAYVLLLFMGLVATWLIQYSYHRKENILRSTPALEKNKVERG